MLRNSAAADTRPSPPTDDSLVSLLGDQRAAIVRRLHRDGELAVGDLAADLGISEVATRRHLAVLEDDDLVASRSVADGPGRPAKRYRLTDRALGLFPQGYASVVEELLDFIAAQQGRDGLKAYLAWRLERQASDLEERVTGDTLDERLEQLASALSEAGFDATVDQVGDRYVLRQDHCAIYEVARDHPEMCAFEAATFSRVLGSDVRLSRRETRAGGGSACVCCVSPRSADAPPPERRLPVLVDRPTETEL
jgi:predicted ArsR family transcriptional regulator